MTLDELSSALGLGDDAGHVVRTVEQLYTDIDQFVADGVDGMALPCKPGCEACCHESVFVCAPEFLAVAAELLTTWTAPRRRALVTEMYALAEEFEDELELLETIPAGVERDEVAFRVRFRCPILSADGRCRVYAARELNGRTFGQTWNHRVDGAYGCELTHEHLRVIQPERGPAMFDAVFARRRFADAFPGIDFVHVYPWWFKRYGSWLT